MYGMANAAAVLATGFRRLPLSPLPSPHALLTPPPSLPPIAFHSPHSSPRLRSPAALIAGSPLGMLPHAPKGGKNWASAMLEAIMATLRRGGDVLVPSDACGRTLEILVTLDDHWQAHKLDGNYRRGAPDHVGTSRAPNSASASSQSIDLMLRVSYVPCSPGTGDLDESSKGGLPACPQPRLSQQHVARRDGLCGHPIGVDSTRQDHGIRRGCSFQQGREERQAQEVREGKRTALDDGRSIRASDGFRVGLL